jgi:hypothetical protein
MPLSDWKVGMPAVYTDTYTNDPKGRVVKTTITKIGRLYVTINGGKQFDVTNIPGVEHNAYSTSALLYTPEQYEEESYREQVRRAVLDQFDWRGRCRAELDVTIRIGDVLGVEKPKHLQKLVPTIEELRTEVEQLERVMELDRKRDREGRV